MTSYNKPNPTHGAKNTTDPRGRQDPKLEAAGPIASDSLAADSLRHGGAFAAGGNPAGILGPSGGSGTFAAVPGGDAKVQEFQGKRDKMPHDIGAPEREVREKTKETTIAGDQRSARHEHRSFDTQVDDVLESRGIDNAPRSAERQGGQEQHTQAGRGSDQPQRGGAGHAGGQEARGSQHTAGNTTVTDEGSLNAEGARAGTQSRTQQTGAVGRPDRQEDVDWSKIPTDTRSTTEIGTEQDPGRAAVQYSEKINTRQSGGGYAGGKPLTHDKANQYDLLNDQDTPEVSDPARSEKVAE